MSGPEKPDQHELRTLVARAQSGDPRAFENILVLYQHGLLRFCRSMINSSGEAEDVLQEVYLSAWRQLSTLQSPEALSVWLYRIARHRCIDHLRKRTPLPQDFHDEEGNPGPRQVLEPRANASLESSAETRAAIVDLRRFVNELPTTQRECWVLKEVHDLSYSDIAKIVSAPLPTVRGRIARARATLAERMQPWK